jgi:hypothetical protein
MRVCALLLTKEKGRVCRQACGTARMLSAHLTSPAAAAAAGAAAAAAEEEEKGQISHGC